MDLFKANNAIVHLGGASTMATQIVSNARSAGLDVAYDFPTLGDGNCFYTSVTQQMKRTDVKKFLDPHLIFTDSHKLRIAVVDYVLRESCKQNSYIQQYKNHYEEILHAENQQRSWIHFLHHQANNAVYATELFIKGTAVFLGIDIHINTPGCNISRPYNVVNRFWQNSHEAVNNSPAAMLLGNICDIHFQSLIFCNEQNDVHFTVEQPPTYAMITKIEKNHSLIPEDNKGYKKTQPHEPNLLNAKNISINSHINIKAIPSLFNSSKLRKVINNASAFQNINIKPLSENNFANNAEQSLLKLCSESGVKYIKPSKNENQQQCHNRRRNMRRNIADAKLKNKSNKSEDISHIDIEKSILKSCSVFNVKYIKPSKNENQQQCHNRRRNMRRNIADAKLKNKSNKSEDISHIDIEKSILKSCSVFNVKYIKPSKNENQQQCHNRRRNMRRNIADAKLKNKSNKSEDISHIDIEKSILKSCSEFNVKYIKPSKNENQQQCHNRRRNMRRHLADAQLKDKINNQIPHQHTNSTVQQHKDTIATLPNIDTSVNTTNAFEPCVKNNLQQEPTTPENVNQGLSYIHHNEQVVSAVQQFEVGELQHTIQTCAVCFQTRPVFNATTFQSPLQQNVSSTDITFQPWKIFNDGTCERCHKERLKRKKDAALKPAKFSGIYSTDIDIGPPTNKMRHQNMHFSEIPPYLKNLTTVEMALISRITVVMNVHLLRYGMLASKGHCVSLPQDMKIASSLPLLPTEVGIVVLRRKGSGKTTQYTVQRNVVQQALKGLCFGFPEGGTIVPHENYECYDGPNHITMKLKGHYFKYTPNPFYKESAILRYFASTYICESIVGTFCYI